MLIPEFIVPKFLKFLANQIPVMILLFGKPSAVKLLLRLALSAVLIQLVLAQNKTSSDATLGRLCCQELSQTSLNVYFANTSTFEARVEHIWSVDAALEPSCFVLPESAQDVSQIVQIITSYECPFGIVSGGHSDWPGSNSVECGVTIDFGYLNTTTYHADTKLASIAPGATWQSVYEILTPQGVTVAGGRAASIGAGGFITGGGNSFFSTSHGWGCDNVQNFEVVLANGSVVDANIDNHNDLWQALKGGSGNLGLVTRFDMYVIEFPDLATPNIWGGIAYYDLGSSGDGVVDAYVDFVEHNHEDKNSSTMLTWAYDYSARRLSLEVAMENTLNTEWPPIFNGYVNVSGMTSNTMRSVPITNITAGYDAGQPSGYSDIWVVGSYKNDARVIKYAAEKHEELIAGELASIVTNDSAMISLCCFFPLTQAMIEHGNENGGNAMGLEEVSHGEEGSIFLESLSISGPENAEKAFAAVKQFVDDVDAYATSLGLNWGWRFLNYAYGYQDPIASYGQSAQDKIRAASDRYDPEKVFQKLRKTGHKIPA